MNLDFNWLYLSTDGRLGRAGFWTGFAGIAAVISVVALIVALTLGPLTFAAQLIVFLCELVIAYPFYAVMAKRFQDRGRPGILGAVPITIFVVIAFMALMGWTGTELVPNLLGQILSFVDLVVVLWVLIDLGILRGTVGPNEFGPDPVAAT
jgi:uncharacterized membrane protein YhaH (DUF805 family)